MKEFKKYWFEIFVAVLCVTAMVIAFARFYVYQDFITYDFVPCDPAQHSCFVTECGDGDPRCTTEMTPEGMYNFAIHEQNAGNSTIYYCNEENIALFGALVIDGMCSE